MKPNRTYPQRHANSARSTTQMPAKLTRYGLARVLSKLGYCSRTQAAQYIVMGRVTVNSRVMYDPETPVDLMQDHIAVDGLALQAVQKVYLMLNKPRGYVTTTHDEQSRDTVYSLLSGTVLPWISPVGRLDKASEGLLLFTNDTTWAARLTSPQSHVEKTYHVQIDGFADSALLMTLSKGIKDDGEYLRAKRVSELRRGEKNSWLEIVLDEGKNRHIRRLLAAHDLAVLRLIRVAIGSLQLGALAKEKWRFLSLEEVAALKSLSA